MNRFRYMARLLAGVLVATMVVFGVLPMAAPAHAAAPATVHLSRLAAAPGDTIGVTGSGFQPGENVSVFVDVTVQGAPRRVAAAAPANGSGNISTSLVLPAGTGAGYYTVWAKGQRAQGEQHLSVLTLLVLKPGSQGARTPIVAGHSFYVRLLGFAPGETIAFSANFPLFNGNSLTESKSTTADKSGNTRGMLMYVPWDAKDGDVTLSVSGQSSNKKASTIVAVIHRPVVQASPTTVRPGGSTAISGRGFIPGSTVTVSATISRPGTTSLTLSKTITTGAHGEFQTSLAVAGNVGRGTYTVTATDSADNLHASTQIKVALSAGISVQPRAARPGQRVQVSGSGYSAGADVQIVATFALYGGGSHTATNTVKTNGDGNFSTGLQIPSQAAPGSVTITAKGPNTQSSTKLQIGRIGSTISVSPGTAKPGSTVHVVGSGFLAGAAIAVSVPVKLTNGTVQTLTAKITTNGNGQFSAGIHVPNNAAGGVYTVVAKSLASARSRSTRLTVARLAPVISVAPISVIPGASIIVRGTGYLPGTRITITAPVKLTNGATQTLSSTTTTNSGGAFEATVRVPGGASGGTYSVTARSDAGRRAVAKLVVAALKPSVIAVPTMAYPGTPITVNGFGFASGETVTVSLSGTKLGTSNADASGSLKATFTVPGNTATGNYQLTAQGNGRTASIALRVYRKISTHFYFASLYTGTGYHEYLVFVNTSEIRARVQITYQPTVGAARIKTLVMNPHARFTQDVNGDLGAHVSASAVVATDVPISAERMVLHGTEGAIDPGATAPSTRWFFANGNTTHGYREFIAVQNPGNGPVQIALHFQPTHHRPFTIYRNMRPQSRTTVKVSSYVHDAVGLVVTSNGPVVANRTIYIHHGISSKTGVTAAQNHWYFATGPKRGSSRHWIGVINTSGQRSHLVIHAYGPSGAELGTVNTWIKPFAREGYLMNTIANQADVAVVVMTSQPSIAEQSTFVSGNHDADTNSFGVANPAKSWQFAEATTWTGQNNLLDVFNPNLAPIPVVVQFINANGSRAQRTYVVPPLAHVRIDVSTVAPNSQLGLLAASNDPFVALDRQLINNGAGAMTSPGTSS